MHYLDNWQLTNYARYNRAKNMRAKRADCDLSSPHSVMSESDITIIKKMYNCKDSTVVDKVIMSPNYPDNYPENQDKEYKMYVEPGFHVSLKFTALTLEDDSKCSYDWVRVVDGDGSELLPQTCGSSPPG